MTKRGKVLRDITSGPGLVIVEGQQFHFSPGVWRSELLPRPGLIVDVKLDAQGKVQAIAAVPESQLAKEQEETATSGDGQDDHSVVGPRIGLSPWAALLLALAWWLPVSLTIQGPFAGKMELTFWQALGLLSARTIPELLDARSTPAAGLYGWIAAAALVSPFLSYFSRHKIALLGGLLPLAFTIAVGWVVGSNLRNSLGGGEAHYGESLKAVVFGPGIYLSVVVGVYFAFKSVIDLVKARGDANNQMDSVERKAA